MKTDLHINLQRFLDELAFRGEDRLMNAERIRMADDSKVGICTVFLGAVVKD